MSIETQRSEIVLLNQMDKEEFAKVLADLIQRRKELQAAILKVVRSHPNIVTRF